MDKIFSSSPRFLVIGSGFISQKHFEGIWHIGGKIVGVIDKNGEDAIEMVDSDYVVILTPNHLHYPLIKKALNCGRIVLCEKPLVLKEEQVKELANYPQVFTVLQLRHHPNFLEIKKHITSFNKISMRFIVHRDEDYFMSWQGDEAKSGGVLFLLAPHYFDLIIQLFGYPTEARTLELTQRKARGIFRAKNYECEWLFDMTVPRDERTITLNGKKFDLMQKENLHKYVYEDLINGKGVRAKDTIKLTQLILYAKMATTLDRN